MLSVSVHWILTFEAPVYVPEVGPECCVARPSHCSHTAGQSAPLQMFHSEAPADHPHDFSGCLKISSQIHSVSWSSKLNHN
jgi:hypothetical protein